MVDRFAESKKILIQKCRNQKIAPALRARAILSVFEKFTRAYLL